MNKLVSLLFLALIQVSYCMSQSLELNVMSFNVRLDAASDGNNNWQYRKDVAAQIVKNFDVDVVGMQEVLPNQMVDLESRLIGYSAIGVGRDNGTNDAESGEHSPLFYKKSKFNEIQSGTFWLSQTPEKPSMGWDAVCARVATWALLEDVASSKKVVFVNTHLDHVGRVAKVEGVRLIIDRVRSFIGDYPLVFTGDFNSTPDSDVIQAVVEEDSPLVLLDSRSIAEQKKEKTGTFHAFGNIPEENRSFIDYIFVRSRVKVLNFEVVDDKLDDVYVSDHNPIFAKIMID